MKNIFCYDLDVLRILLPDYQFISDPIYLPKKTVYVGKERVQGEDDSYSFRSFLNKEVTVSIPDRNAAMGFAAERKRSKPLTSMEKYVSRLQEPAFKRELILFMALGKWKKLSDVDVKIYNLFDALTQSKMDCMKVYFELRQTYSYEEVWSSVLTFLMRVNSYQENDNSLSDYYKGVILKFRAQVSKLMEVVRVVYENDFNEMKVLNTLMRIRYE